MVICKERLKEILVAPRVFEICIRLDRRVSTYTLGLVFRRWPGACTQCERVDVHIRIHTLCGWPANTHTTQIVTDIKQERLKIKTSARSITNLTESLDVSKHPLSCHADTHRRNYESAHEAEADGLPACFIIEFQNT